MRPGLNSDRVLADLDLDAGEFRVPHSAIASTGDFPALAREATMGAIEKSVPNWDEKGRTRYYGGSVQLEVLQLWRIRVIQGSSP